MTDELYHFGIKGMKWGIRNDRKKRVASEEYTRSRVLMKKKPYEMSNRELQEVNTRLQLENTYNNISMHKSIGKKFVDRFTQTSVQKIADGIAGTVAAYGVAQSQSLLKKYGSTVLKNVNG